MPGVGEPLRRGSEADDPLAYHVAIVIVGAKALVERLFFLRYRRLRTQGTKHRTDQHKAKSFHLVPQVLRVLKSSSI